KDSWLRQAADQLEKRTAELLNANAQDVEAAEHAGHSSAFLDRLRLTPSRIATAVAGLRQIATPPDPIRRVIEGHVRPNGLQVGKVGVPLGVIFFLYESRPNVTVDAAGLCVKSGNAVILRGGKEAMHSNAWLHNLLATALRENGLPAQAVQVV